MRRSFERVGVVASQQGRGAQLAKPAVGALVCVSGGRGQRSRRRVGKIRPVVIAVIDEVGDRRVVGRFGSDDGGLQAGGNLSAKGATDGLAADDQLLLHDALFLHPEITTSSGWLAE